jgi:hypothetical protein
MTSYLISYFPPGSEAAREAKQKRRKVLEAVREHVPVQLPTTLSAQEREELSKHNEERHESFSSLAVIVFGYCRLYTVQGI